MPENELISESSPYLLSHAHNPVNWLPWGDKALNKAREENKLMLVSIGYSACHWCHVMEKESFEDLEIARIMNQFFVCIKVDREERPDIDQIYLEAVQIMTGHGGWPLNCFTLPNQKPIYGGTYFRKEDWKNILLNLAAYWKKNEKEAEQYAHDLSQELQNKVIPRSQNSDLPDTSRLLKSWTPNLDSLNGGFLGAPKFPLPNSWIFLIKLWSLLKKEENAELESFIRLTLDRMMEGGIYDQLGGGFARYSTDNHWFAPHFEKMLYDNAQLISLYSLGFTVFKNPEYEKVVRETIQFLKRDLDSREGAYFCALDADSEGVEGKYYVWTQEELKSHLGSFEPGFSLYFHTQPGGNWEGSNILYRKSTQPPLYSKLGLTKEEMDREIRRCTRTLLTHRYSRIPPSLDDKILCSWNALLIKGYCDAYKAIQEPQWKEDAQGIANFLLNKLVKDRVVKRSYKEGKARISGFLEDYAYLADALIDLYQISLDSQWIYKSLELVEIVQENFKDSESPFFYFTDQRDNSLIARKKEFTDSVTPSSNSVLAHVFYKLGHYLDQEEFLKISREMVDEILPKMENYAPSYAHWTNLSLEMDQGTYEICILGKEVERIRKDIQSRFLPFTLISGYNPEIKDQRILPILEEKMLAAKIQDQEKTLIYICRNKVCGLPHLHLEDALREIKEWKG